jgi:signal transduction histidine kinase
MIKKLRIKLILVITFVLILVFGAVFLTLNLSVYNASARETENFMKMIASNDGFFLPQRSSFQGDTNYTQTRIGFNSDAMRARRFFYVKVDVRGNVFEENYDMMFDFSESDAAEYVAEALDNKNSNGKIGRFSYIIENKDYGKIAVFAERSIEIGLLKQLTQTTLIVAGVACAFLFLLSILLSKWMVSPVKNAFEKQSRFISDANHELKTPLTIISANVDVLQNEIGANERIEHIKTQLARMNKLIHYLLTLSKAENTKVETIHSRFDLSKAILSTALEFESRAFDEGKEYKCEIKEGISFVGEEEKLKQLLTILIDNAIQHSGMNSIISVTLKEETGRPHLSIYNTGMGILDNEKNKIFDRFYRSDDSRARETGGYGLGLSIAKTIVDEHNGKIRIEGEYGKWVEFIVML